MTWEDLRLAIGEFITSAGFAGLTALAAATIAYKGGSWSVAGSTRLSRPKPTTGRGGGRH